MTDRSRRRERCAIYTRQSVARPGRDPAVSSCALQYEQCLALILRRGWLPVPDRFDDEGESGDGLDRPAFLRLLDHVAIGAIDRIVVWRLDRLSRVMSDWIELDAMLRRRGIGFTVCDGMIDRAGSSTAAFQMNALAMFAEFERDMIADRIRDGRAVRSARGERTAGKIPFGYQSDRRTKQLIIDPRQAPLVQWMFAQADAGVLPAAIAVEAAARSTERAWTPRSVVRLLQSPVYAGMLPDGRPGAQSPIVARELRDRVLTAIEGRRTRAPAERASAPTDLFLLRGVLVCASCEHPMTTATSTRPRPRGTPKPRYYRCRKLGCDGGQLSAPYVEDRFMRLVRGDRASHLGARTRRALQELDKIWEFLTPINRRRAVQTKFERIVLRTNRTLGVTLRQAQQDAT